nr:MAG TPA: hypothetical protein [Caudoviricetes sp.]
MLHFLTRQEWTDRKNSGSNPPAPTKKVQRMKVR